MPVFFYVSASPEKGRIFFFSVSFVAELNGMLAFVAGHSLLFSHPKVQRLIGFDARCRDHAELFCKGGLWTGR